MKTLAEQKKLVSDLRNDIRNNKSVDEKQLYQFYTELDQLDKTIKLYQSKLYYGKSQKYVIGIFILFLIITIWIVMK